MVRGAIHEACFNAGVDWPQKRVFSQQIVCGSEHAGHFLGCDQVADFGEVECIRCAVERAGKPCTGIENPATASHLRGKLCRCGCAAAATEYAVRVLIQWASCKTSVALEYIIALGVLGADDEVNDNEFEKLVGKKKIQHINLIHQLIVCEDSYYSNKNE